MKWPSLKTFDRGLLAKTPEGRSLAASYLTTRLFIGLIGAALPVVLILLDWNYFADDGGKVIQTSLSAYYHTPARDVFVGGLITIGVLLLTYMAGRLWTWDFILSGLAGLCVLVVALLPTGRPNLADEDEDCVVRPGIPTGCTALQQKYGEHHISDIHLGFAIAFITLLCLLTLLFAVRERVFKKRFTKRARVYLVCSLFMVLAGLWALLGKTISISILDRNLHFTPFYVTEIVSVYAFSIAWFVAGFEFWRWIGLPFAPPPVDTESSSPVPSPSKEGSGGAAQGVPEPEGQLRESADPDDAPLAPMGKPAAGEAERVDPL